MSEEKNPVIEYISVDRNTITQNEIIACLTISYVNENERVFIAARDYKHQQVLKDLLLHGGLKSVCLISNNSHIIEGEPQVIITNRAHCAGYVINDVYIGIVGKHAMFDELTAKQLITRIYRKTSRRSVKWITVE